MLFYFMLCYVTLIKRNKRKESKKMFYKIKTNVYKPAAVQTKIQILSAQV